MFTSTNREPTDPAPRRLPPARRGPLQVEALEPRYLLSTLSDAVAPADARSALLATIPVAGRRGEALVDAIHYTTSSKSGAPAADFEVPDKGADMMVVSLTPAAASTPFEARVDILTATGGVVASGLMRDGRGEVTITNIPVGGGATAPAHIRVAVSPEGRPPPSAPPATFQYVVSIALAKGPAPSESLPGGPSPREFIVWSAGPSANAPIASPPTQVTSGQCGTNESTPPRTGPAGPVGPTFGSIGASATAPTPVVLAAPWVGEGGGTHGAVASVAAGSVSEPGGALAFGGVLTPMDIPQPAGVDLATADPEVLTIRSLLTSAGRSPTLPAATGWVTGSLPEPVAGPIAAATAGRAAIAPLILTAEADGLAAPGPIAPQAPEPPAEAPAATPIDPTGSEVATMARPEGGSAPARDPRGASPAGSGRLAPILAGLGGSSALLTGLLLPDLTAALRPVLDARRRPRRSPMGGPRAARGPEE